MIPLNELCLVTTGIATISINSSVRPLISVFIILAVVSVVSFIIAMETKERE